MDDFELRLKRIPLAKPPGDMKDRIFASEPGGPRVLAIFRRRVPLGWAAMFAVLTGLAGMSLSQWLRPPASLPEQPVIVQIIKAPSERNPFNFAEPAADWLGGELTGRVLAPEEI
jgi:hypothetical protein